VNGVRDAGCEMRDALTGAAAERADEADYHSGYAVGERDDRVHVRVEANGKSAEHG